MNRIVSTSLCRTFLWLGGWPCLMIWPWAMYPATNQPPQSLDTAGGAAAEIPLVEVRGRVVCLAEEMHRLYQSGLPTGHEHLYGFKADEGKYYTLLRTKFSEALFADERFRQKQLLLKGRLLPGTQLFDVTLMRSIRDGVVYDIYYYCDICDIQAVAPGPCECCQGPTELVEKKFGE